MNEKLERLYRKGFLDKETKDRLEKLNEELEGRLEEEKKDLKNDLYSFGLLMDNL